MTAPPRSVYRTRPSARMSRSGSPCTTAMSAASPGATRPVRAAIPKRCRRRGRQRGEDLGVRQPRPLHVDVLVGRIVLGHVADVGAEQDLAAEVGERAGAAPRRCRAPARRPPGAGQLAALVRPQLQRGHQRHAALTHRPGQRAVPRPVDARSGTCGRGCRRRPRSPPARPALLDGWATTSLPRRCAASTAARTISTGMTTIESRRRPTSR